MLIGEKMMKIALSIVLGGDLVRSTEHVGIGYIASCLREKGHDVSIIEVKDINNKEDYEKLLVGNFDVVGFTTTCITLKMVLQMAQILKDNNSSVINVCGGHMATFSGEEILKNYKQIDFIIYGEGEITFNELLECIEEKGNLASVKGLMYKNDSKVFINEERELISNLDTLPFPARDQFIQHDFQFQYLRISTSRGCLGNCGFCSSFVGRKQKGPRWRGRSPKNVVDEIEHITTTYNFHTYDFVDSTFEDPGAEGKQRIRDIAYEILDRNLEIYYNCCFRAENWTEKDRETLSILVKSGLEKVNIGFESGNDRGLRILNKRARMQDNWEAIKILREFPDIYITFGFIMLHPYSTMEDIFDNAKFLHDTGFGQVIRHYFWQLEVYPSTLMEEKLIIDNILCKDYDIADGIYKYKFVDDRVACLSPIFNEFLKLKSVWDFEIFDILIHTFITRLRRKYSNTNLVKKINSFSNFVDRNRKEIADFNYEFFMKLYHFDSNYNIEDEKSRLDSFLVNKMNMITNMQYQIGRELLKMGQGLVKR